MASSGMLSLRFIWVRECRWPATAGPSANSCRGTCARRDASGLQFHPARFGWLWTAREAPPGSTVSFRFTSHACLLSDQSLSRCLDHSLAVAFQLGLFGNVEDIVGNMTHCSWYMPKAREVINVYHYRTITRLHHVQAIDVQAEDFANAPRQLAPLQPKRNKLLLHFHLRMKWRFPGYGVNIFAYHIQLDVVS